MRVVAIAVLAVGLAAGSVLAGIPAGVFSTPDAPVQKFAFAPTRTATLDCSGAIEVTLDGVYYGDNTGLPNNVDGYSCNPWWEPGGTDLRRGKPRPHRSCPAIPNGLRGKLRSRCCTAEALGRVTSCQTWCASASFAGWR